MPDGCSVLISVMIELNYYHLVAVTQLRNHNTLSGAERTGVGGLSGSGRRALSCCCHLLVSVYFQLHYMWSSVANLAFSVHLCAGGGAGEAWEDRQAGNGTEMSLRGGQDRSGNEVGGGGRNEQ